MTGIEVLAVLAAVNLLANVVIGLAVIKLLIDSTHRS